MAWEYKQNDRSPYQTDKTENWHSFDSFAFNFGTFPNFKLKTFFILLKCVHSRIIKLEIHFFFSIWVDLLWLTGRIGRIGRFERLICRHFFFSDYRNLLFCFHFNTAIERKFFYSFKNEIQSIVNNCIHVQKRQSFS